MKSLFFALAFLLPSALLAERVVKVSDGDTVTVLDKDNKQTRVRLHGIDAPEKKQPFGEAARRHLADAIAGKDVRLEITSKDRYGRTVARIWLGETDINLRQVADGYAWHYVAYAKTDTTLAAAEKSAREKKLGLWADANPVPPWVFRRRKPTSATPALLP